MENPQVRRSARRAAAVGFAVLVTAMVAMLCAAAVARAATTPIFYSTSVGAGLGPTWAEPIDVTGDGHLDLVVANGDDDTVSVLAGDGDGHFGPATSYPTGGDNPYSLDVAELTGDGVLDIAVANRTSATVTILKGGAGGFTFLRSYNVGTETIDVKALDLDDDGDLDLAATEMWSGPTHVDGTLWLLYNNGSGTFRTAEEALPFDGGTVLGVGDLNEDGSVDVAVGHSYSTITSVLMNDGNGVQINPSDGMPISNLHPSSALAVGPNPQGSTFGDFNGDGHQDICVTSRYPNYANIFLGDGTGAFTGPTSYAVGAYAKVPVAVDLNGDGDLDLAVCNYGNEGPSETGGTTISILTGNGDGTFNAQSTIAVGVRPHSIGVGDFDEDGSPDLAVSNWASDDVTVLLNMTPHASDDTAPVTTSSADTAWHKDPVTVTLSATDAGSGVAETKYRIDGGAWQTYTAGFSISAEGDHTVQFYSVDRVGNQEPTRTAHVKIDVTAPVTSSSADSAWHKTPVTVTLSPTDAVGEVAQTTYRVDGGAWQTGTSFVVGADGDHTIQFYSEDAAGNVEPTSAAHVKVDATAPVVTMGAPLADAGYVKDGGVVCTWSAADATSGVANEAATLDGVPIVEGAAIDALAVGRHTFIVTATDAAGNQRVQTVAYNVTAPTSLTPASVTATVTWGASVKLGATLKDVTSGSTLGGKTVELVQSANKTDWTPVGPATPAAAGKYEASVKPAALAYYRFRFAGDASHAPSVSGIITVRVRPLLGRPQVRSVIRAGGMFSVTGSLKPHFTKGAKTVKITVYRSRAGRWVAVKALRAVNADSGSYSKYVLKMSLKAKGKYRFKATTSTTSAWAPATSSFSSTLTVK